MITLYIILWYLIGSIGGLYLSYLRFSKVTVSDLIFLLTIGGIGGVLTVVIGLSATWQIITEKTKLRTFLNKKVF